MRHGEAPFGPAVICDGMGHNLRPAQVGVPFSTTLATLALAGAISARSRPGWRSTTVCWTCIAVVRCGGTYLGDILAFSTSLAYSLIATASAMIAVLLAWRERGSELEDDAIASPA